MTAETAAAAGWCGEVAAVLAAASERTARLAVQIAEDWLDDRGREWAERAALLHRELERSAAAAAALGTRFTGPDPSSSVLWPIGPVIARHRGPRLGGTSGARTGDDTGMQIAELPPG